MRRSVSTTTAGSLAHVTAPWCHVRRNHLGAGLPEHYHEVPTPKRPGSPLPHRAKPSSVSGPSVCACTLVDA
jgi:hypothetical protein